MEPVIRFDFLEHYYIEKKERYESILCELINLSPAFQKIGGGSFSQVSIQNKSQPDVIASASGYSLDFKMMISQTLAEFRNLSKPHFVEIFPGVKVHQAGKKVKQKAVFFPSAIRDITEEQLQQYRSEKDQLSKSIVHFFDKLLNISKNILIFLPLYVSNVETSLPSDVQYERIFNEFSTTLQYIHTYRSLHQFGFDTFFVYIVKDTKNRKTSFVITQFTNTGLCLLDTIDMFSLTTVRNLFDKFSY